MKHFLVAITLCTLFFSCESTKKENTDSSINNSIDVLHFDKEIDYLAFKIKTPTTWEKLQLRGIDSYVGALITDHGDTITFDLGKYSNSLREDENTHTILYDTIDNYKVKIIYPKKVGSGITGIYIDSLWKNDGSDINRFNFYGSNLSSDDQYTFLKVIRTIKFNEGTQK